MNPAAILITLVGILCATGVMLYAIHSGNERARLSYRRERDDGIGLNGLASDLIASTNDSTQVLAATIDKLLAALTEPINTPQQPVLVHEQEVAGQAQDAIREFHDGFTGDPVDTPDWTDSWFPDARGTEPRIASVRPGDSVIPGQGNWDAMMNEGRAVVGDEVVGGDEQWEGERYE